MEKSTTITIYQSGNGVIVRPSEEGFRDQAQLIGESLVFNDMKELKAFIGKHFIDAEAAKRLEAAENKKEHKEK